VAVRCTTIGIVVTEGDRKATSGVVDRRKWQGADMNTPPSPAAMSLSMPSTLNHVPGI